MNSSPAFYQIRTGVGVSPSDSGLVRYADRPVTTDSHNGLWNCRLNGRVQTATYVGVYQRGRGEWVFACMVCMCACMCED
jgi:hypothetical protein